MTVQELIQRLESLTDEQKRRTVIFENKYFDSCRLRRITEKTLYNGERVIMVEGKDI